jgi:hypothetical protein
MYRFLIGAALVALLGTTPATAGPVLTFGENGQTGSSGAGTVVFTVTPDPVSGIATMAFTVGDALGIVNPAPGDVLVRESGRTTTSDLLRFVNSSPGFGGLLFVFSDLEAGGPDSVLPGNPPVTSDVGIPKASAGAVTRDEVALGNGMVGLVYTPGLTVTGAPEPGWIPGGVTYIFISDVVPEPSSIVLAALGAFGLVGYGRRRGKVASA